MEPLPRSWLIMVSLCTILHGHGILAKIMARSWQGYQGTCHGSWQGCHGFEHWVGHENETRWQLPNLAHRLKLKRSKAKKNRTVLPQNALIQLRLQILKTQGSDFGESVQIYKIFAELCRYVQIRKYDLFKLRNTKTPHIDVKRIIKMFKIGEKSYSCQTDETFFCNNLYRSVEIQIFTEPNNDQ